MRNFFFFLITLFSFSSNLLQAESYTFSGGKNSVAQIIASKILSKAYNRAGIQVNPIFQLLEKSLLSSNAGEIDGELARIKYISELYPNLRIVPVPIISIKAAVFSKNTSLVINNWSDLRGHKLTIINGAKFIEIGTSELKRTLVDTFEQALEALDTNKTEIVVAPHLGSTWLKYKKKYFDIKTVNPSLQTLKLYHFVHKRNAHLIPIITPILQAMKDSGEIAHIIKVHLNKIAQEFSKGAP